VYLGAKKSIILSEGKNPKNHFAEVSMSKSGINDQGRECPICKETILPHEIALFFSGRDNLVQLRVGNEIILLHRHCADSFETRSSLLRFLTNDKEDLSWLE